MGRKLWHIAEYDKKKAVKLSEESGANEFAVLLLHARGMQTAEEISAFLQPHRELSAPWLLKDMDRAVERIRRAVEENEKITVFGDYDADGVTATALLFSYLEAIGASVSCYIPSRMTEGYGLSESVCDRLAADGTKLVVTVDNGIGALEEARYLKERGIDLVVTDHHRAGSTIPDCCAVVDPFREDDTSPFKELAGVGVAMKLAAALEDGDYESILAEYADIVAIGTIADIVPLVGENRTIVLAGLDAINAGARCGVAALRAQAGAAERELTSLGVAFTLAPRINAAGRMGSAEKALQLLLTEAPEEAMELAAEIDHANIDRQETETEIFTQAEAFLDAHPRYRTDRVLVVDGNNWHPGVIGIVASRLVERYGRPAIVISHEPEGTAKGSGRSIAGFSLYEALCDAAELLPRYGGHTLAAGFSIAPEDIGEFRRRVNAFAAKVGDVFPSLTVDCRLNPAHVSVQILDALRELEPFGAGNPAPLFGLFNMEISSIKGMGNNRHLRLMLSREGAHLTAVKFGTAPEDFPYVPGDRVDLVVRIEKNIYMGEIRTSIQIRDIRPAGSDDESLFASMAIYARLCRGEELTEAQRATACPSRALLTQVYKYIRQNGAWRFEPEVLCLRLGLPGQNAAAVLVALAALTERGVLQQQNGAYTHEPNAGKAVLADNPMLQVLGYRE